MTNIYYLIAPVGHESGKSLAGFPWLKEILEGFFKLPGGARV